MKVPQEGKDLNADRYYPEIKNLDEAKYFQEITDEIYTTNNISISTLAMDFDKAVSYKVRKQITEDWIQTLPTLDKVKELSVRHRVDQRYFEAICSMKNLEALMIWSSSVKDLSQISKLKKLKSLYLSGFSKVTDISPLRKLSKLEYLGIERSFKVTNYDMIGRITSLKALTLGGDTFAPKNLMLDSLAPFANLRNLIQLDLSSASIRQKDYEQLLNLKKLRRLDASWRMPQKRREEIQNNHPSLRSGFFMVYDFTKSQFKEGVEWWV